MIETVLKRQSKERSKLENKLRNEVIQYFTKLEKQVLTTYKKASSQGIPPHNIQVLIMMLIQSWHQEYTPLLDYYHQLIQKLASNQNNELIHLQQRKTLGLKRSNETLTLNPVLSPEDNPIKLLAVKVQTKLDDLLENEEPKHYIIEENKQITEQIKQSNFNFSEKTRQRVNSEINSIIAKSETEGIGPYQVAEQIRDKFAELKGYEANRIARTEINRADNTYRYDDIMNNDLIDYIQWHGHDDGKERDSHIKCNGEIIRKGELFSNGLRHPGDPHGPAKEVINCRCTIVPWIPPFDKMPPTGIDHFKESDLLPKPADAGQQFLLETIENTRIITPTQGGMNVAPENLQISRVKGALNEATNATLAGEIKNKQQLQTTLNKLLKIGKPTKKPIKKPEIIKPTDTKEIQELKQTVNELTEQIEQNTYKYKFTPEEQESYDSLMDKFMGSGGYLDLKKGKPVLKGGKLTAQEKEQLTKLHEKKLSILKKPTKKATPQNQSTQQSIGTQRNRANEAEAHMSSTFRQENPEIIRKMDDFGLQEGEHYHYIQDENGNIYIEWKSNIDDNIKYEIDDFIEHICPDNELFGNTAQRNAIDAYTGNGHKTINSITRMAKKYRNIIKDEEFKEKFINIHGIEKWTQFKTQLNQAYNQVYIQKTNELTNRYSEDILKNLRNAFFSQSAKLPCNTRLYRGERKWHGKLPEVGDGDTLGSFYSTSHDLRTASNFANSGSDPVIIKIDCPEGTDALLIGDRGVYGDESEILFAPDQKIEYTNVFRDEEGRLNIHAKLVNENIEDIDEFMDYISNYNIEW